VPHKPADGGFPMSDTPPVAATGYSSSALEHHRLPPLASFEPLPRYPDEFLVVLQLPLVTPEVLGADRDTLSPDQTA
jgi:hypothetical protein